MCSILCPCSLFRVQGDRVWGDSFIHGFDCTRALNRKIPQKVIILQKETEKVLRKGNECWAAKKELCQRHKETYDSHFNVHPLSYDKTSFHRLTGNLIPCTLHCSPPSIPAVVTRGGEKCLHLQISWRCPGLANSKCDFFSPSFQFVIPMPHTGF